MLGKKLVYTIEDDQNTQTTAVNVVTKILTQDVAGGHRPAHERQRHGDQRAL